MTIRNQIFAVTEDWLLANRTDSGGFTKAQLSILEVPWPPKNGWLKERTGWRITAAEKRAFESARNG